MKQNWITAAYYRGGTSKGVFFQAKDLPTDNQEELVLSNFATKVSLSAYSTNITTPSTGSKAYTLGNGVDSS